MPPESQNQFNPTNNTSAPENTFLKRKYFGLYFVLAIALFALASVFLLWWINRTSNEITLNSKIILSGPVNHFAGWQTYTNEKYGFELKFPSNWLASSTISSDSQPLWFQSTTSPSIHGIGIPPVGAMWVNIAQGICNSSTSDFLVESKPDILEKIVCQNNFQVTLGLWQKDQNLIENENILNQILSTFKFIPSTSSGQVSTSTPTH
jgi:hypothetical protein